MFPSHDRLGANISRKQKAKLDAFFGGDVIGKIQSPTGKTYRVFIGEAKEMINEKSRNSGKDPIDNNFWFDEAGFFFESFDPNSVFDVSQDFVVDSSNKEIISSPKFNENGVDFDVRLNNKFVLGRKVFVINSKTYDRFLQSA